MEPQLDANTFKAPVLFFANAIGDHLLVLPTIRALARIFAGRLSLIAMPGAEAEIFSEIRFQRVFPLHFAGATHDSWQKGAPGNPVLPFDYVELAKQVGHCDLFVSLTVWHSAEVSSLVAQLAPPLSIGFFSGFTHQLASPSPHSFDKAFAAVHLFQPLEIEEFAAPPQVPAAHRTLARTLWQALDGAGNRLLVLHTDSKRRKMWSADKFMVAVDEFLSAQPNFIAIVIGLYPDLPLSRANNRSRIFDLSRLPLPLSFAVVSIADVFLGIDSCMLHAADLSGVPCVGIFGPTHPEKWGVRFAPHVHLTSDDLGVLPVGDVVDALLHLTAPLSSPHTAR